MATMTPLPTPPQRTDDEVTFANRGDALLGALPQFVTEANALIAQADSDSANATMSAANAATSATGAAASAQAAANAAGATLWVSGTTYAQYVVVYSPTDLLSYRKKTASSVSTIDPVTDATNWARLAPITVIRSTRTSNSILTSVDNAKLIDVTSGTFSQTITASATLGNTWWCYYRNLGSGVITLDPNGSETINGAATITVQTGETFILQCDGSNINALQLTQSSRQDFITTSGSFTPEIGRTYFIEYAAGAGGGASGDASNTACNGGGGGQGGQRLTAYHKATSSTVWAITIGAGGNGGVSVSQSGSQVQGLSGAAGTNTTVGPFPSATGGTAGVAGGGGASNTPPAVIAASASRGAGGANGIGISFPTVTTGQTGAAAGGNAGGAPGIAGTATDDFFKFGSSGGSAPCVWGNSAVVASGASAGYATGGTGGTACAGAATGTSAAGQPGTQGYVRIWTI